MISERFRETRPPRSPTALALLAAVSIAASCPAALAAPGVGRDALTDTRTAGEAGRRRARIDDVASAPATRGDGAILESSRAVDRDPASVRDESGKPVAGARVSFWAREALLPSLIETRIADGDGLARLEDVPRGTAVVSVGAAGFLARVVAPADAGREGVTLSRGRSVTLRVVGALDALPVRAYDVLVVPDAVERSSPAEIAPLVDGLVTARIVSDDGVSRVSGVPAGPATAIVTAAGFAPAAVRLEPSATEAVAGLDPRGCSEIPVFDADTGLPVAGARAAASPELLEGPLARIAAVAASDERGLLTVCGSGRMLVAHRDYAPAWIDAGREGFDASTGIPPLLLDRGGTIEGRIHDELGTPLEGVVVRARASGLERAAVSGAAGAFVFERVAPGGVLLEAGRSSAADDGADWTLRRTVRVERGETSRVLLSPSSGYALTLSGDVPLEPGSTALLLGPAGGGRLEVIASADLSPDGSALLPIPHDERDAHSVAVRGARDVAFSPVTELDIADDERAARWEISGRRVAGVVVDRRSSRGIAGASVVCMPGGVLHVGRGDDALSFEPGRVRLSLTGPGTAAVTDERGRFGMLVPPWCRAARVLGAVTAPSEPPWAELVADTSGWNPGEPVRLELERGPLILVELSLAGSSPTGVIEVALRRPGEPLDRLVTAAVAGRARLAPPGDGAWDVIARAPGLAPALERVDAAGHAQPAEVSLSVSPGGHLLIARAAGRAGSDGLRILDHRGVDWATLVELAPLPSDPPLIEAGPLPPGRYTVVDGGLRASGQIRFDGDVRSVRLTR